MSAGLLWRWGFSLVFTSAAGGLAQHIQGGPIALWAYCWIFASGAVAGMVFAYMTRRMI